MAMGDASVKFMTDETKEDVTVEFPDHGVGERAQGLTGGSGSS